MNVQPLSPGKYVIAVSGGVDSVVLLDLLTEQPDLELVVAHFDHGIREDAHEDAELVRNLSSQHGLKFVEGEGKLGPATSEAQARVARYEFLSGVQQSESAIAIVTAHHRDDVIETIIINVMRGTGWRGLCSLRETSTLKRPLLKISKAELREYAQTNGLKWREDSTNQHETYLRNRIRQSILPSLRAQNPGIETKLYELYAQQCDLRQEIEMSLEALTSAAGEGAVRFPRPLLISLPNDVGREVLYALIAKLPGRRNLSQRRFYDLLVFAKTARVHTQTSISKDIVMRVNKREIILANE